MHDRPKKPGKVTALGVMYLIGGIYGIIMGISVALATCFIWLPWIYSLVLGVMAIIKGANLLSHRAQHLGQGKHIPVMQVINVINFDVMNLGLGIAGLVVSSDPDVQEYFEPWNQSRQLDG